MNKGSSENNLFYLDLTEHTVIPALVQLKQEDKELQRFQGHPELKETLSKKEGKIPHDKNDGNR